MPYKNKAQQLEYQRKWMAARRVEYFKDKRCMKCGASDDLELDHIDPAKKVSHRIWSWTAERRDAELAKCQVLCNVCHKVKTKAMFIPSNPCHGTDSRYMRGCKCGLCLLYKRNSVRRSRANRARVSQ